MNATAKNYDRAKKAAWKASSMANARLAMFRSGQLPSRREFRILRDRAERLHRLAATLNTPAPVAAPAPALPSIDMRRKDRMRRTAQAGLRKLGFERETTTGSGSSYYFHNSGVRVRVSDHDVPLTDAREGSSWSWATHGTTILTNPESSTIRQVRNVLRSIEKDIKK